MKNSPGSLMICSLNCLGDVLLEPRTMDHSGLIPSITGDGAKIVCSRKPPSILHMPRSASHRNLELPPQDVGGLNSVTIPFA